ncbi:MAG: DNA translocase FtsK [Clostridia bacterium]|nr:DNA translocase FtsK [Clostridia bacterium]
MAKRKYKKRKKDNSIDLKVIGTIIGSILLAILIYANSGELGSKLSDVLGGMMGWIKYILPIGTFAIAIKIACNEIEEEYITHKLIQYAILLICIAIVMSIYQISQGNLEVSGDLSRILKKAYTLGTSNVGGGAIGTLAAVPLVRLLGNLGAVVVSVGAAVMLFAFVFGLDISQFISSIVENWLERHEENKAEREARKQERYEEIEARRIEMMEHRKEARKQREAMNVNQIDTGHSSQNMEQIKINLNGRAVEETEEQSGLFGRLKNKSKKKQEESHLSVAEMANSIDPIGATNKVASGSTNKAVTKNKNVAQNAEVDDMQDDSLFVRQEEQKEDKTKQVLQLQHTLVVEEDNYVFPSINLLSKSEKKAIKGGTKALQETAAKLQRTLHSFGVQARVENVSVGPAITRYELKPAEGVRVSKIANLADDIALNLAAETIRIEAPIPGKQAVGIEVPNKEKEMVPLRDVIESDEFQHNNSKLSIALGKDVAGNVAIGNIAKMPHVLIAGSTGSGKSVCINTIITSIIYNAKPSEVKLVMVDPKVVELSVYNGIPHLLIPVVTDPKKAAGALAWAVQEMDNRYNLFAEKGVRDLKGYNHAVEKEGEMGKLPQIVIIIDELADLMMVAAKEVEESICRLAQKARAAGMHLVIATQRPSVDVITGLIKANVPSRIAFAVSSQVDSRTILDQVGAEKLLGKGDMLFFPAGEAKPVRVQGAFVSDEEVESIVEFIKSNGTATYSEDILESIENSNKTDKEKALEAEQSADDEADPFLQEAINTVVETGQASTSFIQRRFKVGYARAGRIIDQMEERGVISGYQGSKPREVLWTLEKLAELNMAGGAVKSTQEE